MYFIIRKKLDAKYYEIIKETSTENEIQKQILNKIEDNLNM